MKKGLKFVMMTLVLAVVFNSSAMAQRGGNNGERPDRGERPSPQERAEKKLDKLTKKLELNDYQVDRIRDLSDDFISQAETIKNGNLERDQKREEMKALRDGMNNEIKALLDATQLEKYEEILARKKDKKGNKSKGNRPPRGDRE